MTLRSLLATMLMLGLVAALLLGVMPCPGMAQTAGPPVYSTATGSYYQLVPTPGLTWAQAFNEARFRMHQGRQGRLVTITSLDEEQFILKAFGPTALHRTWIGAKRDRSNPPSPWYWINNEPFSYADWAPGEPNNTRLASTNIYFYQYPGKRFGWADVAGTTKDTAGYLVEYPRGR